MKNLRLISFTLALGCASAIAADKPSGESMHQRTAPAHDADNTGLNVRDKDDASATPQTQTNNEADRKLLAAVRRAVVDDKDLSLSAHNVKILTSNGVVTLRGPVKSDAEKIRIGKLAMGVAGVTKVENHLEIEAN